MKYCIIIPDGASETPLDELDGRTPLEVANLPNMDRIAMTGRLGTARTTPPGYAAGSDVCTLCLLGYNPDQYHPGRAPLEAKAMGLELDAADWVFRCNLVTIVETPPGGWVMMDHSAGHIGDSEARILLEEVRKRLAPDPGTSPLTFYPGVSYRHLMTFRGVDFTGLKCTPPHDIPDQPIKGHMPKGKNADLIASLILQSHEVLARHEINLTRKDLGENQATHIWLWGQGKAAEAPSFLERYGKRGAMITAVDLLRGIANLIGWVNLDCPGITSYHDNDYAAQGKFACDALDRFDVVCCHVEAPDESSHAANYAEKIESLEAIDRHVVGPILAKMQTYKEWRVMVLPDHATQCSTRLHHDEPVPFAIAGTGMHNVFPRPFTEKAAKESDLHIQKGYDLMEYFLAANSGR